MKRLLNYTKQFNKCQYVWIKPAYWDKASLFLPYIKRQPQNFKISGLLAYLCPYIRLEYLQAYLRIIKMPYPQPSIPPCVR